MTTTASADMDPRRLHEHLRILSSAIKVFARASESSEQLLDAVVREVAESLQCACALNLIEPGGEYFTTRHVHAADPEFLREYRAHFIGGDPKRIDAYHATNRVVQTRAPVFRPRIDLDAPHGRADPAIADWIRAIRLKSALVVPLVVSGQVIGTLGLMRRGDDTTPLDEHDLTLAESLAEHAALALVSARLLEEARGANEKLRESEEAQRLLFDGSPIPLIVFDIDTLAPLATNDAALELYGYDRDEFMQLKVSDLPVAGRETTRARLAAWGDAEVSGTSHYRRKDGSQFVAEYTTRAFSFVGRRARITAIKDVTARYEAERTSALLAAIVESSNDAIVSKRLDGTITSWNAAAERLFGYSTDEAVGKSITIVVPSDRLDEERSLLARVAAGGRVDQYETLRRRKDGTEVAVSISLAPVLDSAGTVVGASKTARDLTLQRKSEEALLVAKKRFTSLFDSGIIGIIVADVGGALCDANDTFLAMTGYSRDDLVSGRLNWRALTPPEWVDWDAKTVEEVLGTGRSNPREKEYLRRDGTRVPVLVGVAKVEGPFAIAVSVDLTETKRAEAVAAAEQARFRALVENSADGITLNTLDARLAYVSPAAARIFGSSAEQLTGERLLDYVHPDDRVATSDVMRRVRETAGAVDTTVQRIVRKDGSCRWVEITRTNRLEDAAVGGVVCNLRDITDRKLADDALAAAEKAKASLEAQLRQAQKMDAVGRLAGGVAHDFNNVLSVILSYGDMLHADLRQDDPMRADIEEITKAGQRAAALTRQLLLFSRQQVVEPKVLNLNDLLAGMDRMLRRILGEDVELTSVPDSEIGRIRADASNIEQVIVNLVVNARDAMPTGGQITIESRNVELDAEYARDHVGSAPGPHVMLAVTDTGVGMDRATQARIFEPFFTTKGPGKGTGLGLSTVFGIAQQSGGSVWVYSEPGKGTTFKVYFPRVEAEVDVRGQAPPPTTLKGHETILLVEDEEQVRTVAHGILKRNGYRVIVAQSPGEALFVCESRPGDIDLLLTDVVMPQMSGPELAKRLAKARPDMRVLCMSGYTDDSVVRHGVLESGVAFLQKPFTMDTLLRKVREVLSPSST